MINFIVKNKKLAMLWLLLLCICSLRITVSAQDPLFSQFYLSPQYLNPAFTGTGKNEFRANFNSRLQWMNLQTPLQYFNANADFYFSGPKMSLGGIANRFNEGYLKTSQAYLVFAKNFGADETDCRNWFVNVAFQGGIGATGANRKKFLFPDQIDLNGPNGQPSQFELFQNSGKTYFDMSVGMVFCFYNVMAGAAMHHINEPPYGLLGSGDASRLPQRFTVHLSYVNNNPDYDGLLIKPTVIYNSQGVSNSLVIGSLFELTDWAVGGGIWYRNNFGRGKNLGVAENHTLNIGITLKLGSVRNHYNGEASMRLNTGFSYEAELNRPGVRYTKGSMEGGMLYEKNLDGSSECRSVDCDARYPWVFF